MLALIVVGAGALFSLVFHVGTKEAAGVSEPENQLIPPSPSQQPAPPRPVLRWNQWLKEPAFYQVTFLNLCHSAFYAYWERFSSPFFLSSFLTL